MGGGVAGQPLQLPGKIQQLLYFGIGFIQGPQLPGLFQRLVQGDAQHIGHQLGDPVRVRIGHIQRPAHIPNGCLSRHGAKGDDLGHMVRPVFLHHIVDDLLPPLDAKIDVEIRHGHPLRI